ncbi:basic proline-rich protein-like [Phyllostomus hastatus]|uniref:basic proline-rich protein-like n=1 Tax=Phyllostomus hastatus TaxID=9423 RepID=UPI001E680029|nr:basic proline-rich protein-like [Phyllostomus hastatus]
MQPAKSGPHRARPARPAAVAPGAPPAGMGVGPGGHRPANSRSQGESAPHPLRRPQTYLQGIAVSRGAQGGESSRGAAAGQRGPSRGSRGPRTPLSTRPLPPPPPPFCLPLGVAAAALRRRFPGCGHFPASLARGPTTGGFGPLGRLRRAPPAASCPPPGPAPLCVASGSPASRCPVDSPRTLLSPTHTRKPCHHAGSTRAVQKREAAQHIFKYTDENLLGMNAVEGMIRLEMPSRVPSASGILQPSKKLFDSSMNKGSDNEQIHILVLFILYQAYVSY